MKPTITAVGIGAADSTKYFQTSFFIRADQTNLLIDTGGGSGILTQLEKCTISIDDIQHIFVTHKHIDHIFGLFWILRFRGASIANGKAEKITVYASSKKSAGDAVVPGRASIKTWRYECNPTSHTG